MESFMQNLPPNLLAVIDELDAARKDRDDAWQVPRVEASCCITSL
jgi:hypothetical protein